MNIFQFIFCKLKLLQLLCGNWNIRVIFDYKLSTIDFKENGCFILFWTTIKYDFYYFLFCAMLITAMKVILNWFFKFWFVNLDDQYCGFTVTSTHLREAHKICFQCPSQNTYNFVVKLNDSSVWPHSLLFIPPST